MLVTIGIVKTELLGGGLDVKAYSFTEYPVFAL